MKQKIERTFGVNGVSYRLARTSILIALLVGLLISLIEVFFDYRAERGTIRDRAIRVLEVANPSAANAVNQLDEELAAEVVQGLSRYGFIASAQLFDDSGNVLAEFHRQPENSNTLWLTTLLTEPSPLFSSELRSSANEEFPGKLDITLDADFALAGLYDRVVIDLILGVAKAFLLSMLLFFVFYTSIARPISLISRKLKEIDPEKPRPIGFSTDELARTDEVGQLKRSLDELLSGSRKTVQELNETQLDLIDNQTRLRDFARAASDWFWETDEELVPIFNSDRYYELTGYDVDTHLANLHDGKPNTQELPGPDQSVRQALVRDRKPFRDLNFVVVGKRGQKIHARSSGVPYFDVNGTFRGYRGVSADMTELQASETERQRLSDELSHAQKLSAIGQLTGGIAHDFNNLLAIIMGSLETIQLEDLTAEERKQLHDIALDATNRGAQLTHRLLAYSRQQPLSPTRIDPKDVLNELSDLLRRSLGERIELEVVSDGGQWSCIADRQELETVLLNLAINARDAMPNGGKLTIDVFNARLDDEYALTGYEISPGQYVCFAVSDTGTGMTQDTIDRAFDPYFTTKPVGKGSGLGLSMAFGFVKQSKGHIRIYSEIGQGTTVKIYLPKSGANNRSKSAEPRRLPDQNALNGLRILVVEDDIGVRETVKIRLEKLGCVVFTAPDPEESLSQAEEIEDVDVLLLDVVLPGPMKSTELAARLLQKYSHAACVYMSGYTENAIVHGGQLDEGVLLLQKPFSTGDLKAILVRALRDRSNQPRD